MLRLAKILDGLLKVYSGMVLEDGNKPLEAKVVY
jgi:hypothetical protein